MNKTQMVAKKIFTIDLLKAIMNKNEHMTKVVAEACRTILELHISEDAPVDVRIRKLDVRVCDV